MRPAPVCHPAAAAPQLCPSQATRARPAAPTLPTAGGTLPALLQHTEGQQSGELTWVKQTPNPSS